MRRFNKIKRYLPFCLLGTTLLVSQVSAQNATVKDNLSKTSQVTDTIFVKGIVRMAANHKPIGGISVSVPGYSAAITGDDGSFRIAVQDLESVLFMSGEGVQVKQVPLRGRNNVTVDMYDPGFISQYEPMSLLFGKSPKNFVPYAVQSFNTNDKWSQSVTETPDGYLQGRIAGLNVIRHSGTPGIGANVTLNGYTSLNASNQPLIVVDGVIYDNTEYGHSLVLGNMYNPLSDIDIKDIENITVLKGGNSTYGTKGANGVIQITTSRSQELATRIDFAAYGGYNFAPTELPVLQAGDYRILLSELLKTKGLSADEIADLPYMVDRISEGDYYNYHNNTDWQNQVLNSSYNSNYYLKVTGGDNIAKYALSLGYLTNGGVLKNADLNKYQMRFNGDLQLSKKLTASVNLGLVSMTQNLLEQGGEGVLSPLSLSLIKSPFLSVNVRDHEGVTSPNLSGFDSFRVSNPVAIANNMQGKNKSYRFTGAVKFNYQLNNDFSLKTIFGLTFDKMQEDVFVPESGVVPDTLSSAVAFNRSGSNMARYFSFYNNTALSYNKSFNNNHKLQVDLGYRFENNKFENEYGHGYNSATDEFVSVGMGNALLRQVGGADGKWNWLNTYLHADYSIRDKYFLSANAAADGSSRFGKQAPDGFNFGGVKFALNPSIAAGWLISSEDFFANVKFVDNLKLRASYSRVGNDDIGNYTARQYYVSQNLVSSQGIVRGNIGNPALEWEHTDQLNFGLDAALWNERLSFSLDYFNNKSDNVITIAPTAEYVGLDYIVANNSAMSNKGVELALNARILNGKLKWDLGLNVSKYENKVEKLAKGAVLTDYVGATYLTKVGQAANLFYGYTTNGVFSSDQEALSSGLHYENTNGVLTAFKGGDIIFDDKDNNHIINDADRQVIGNPNPKWFGGITNNFSWKAWSLNTLFTFSQGNDIYNYTRMQLESMSGYQNQSVAVNNRWRFDGQVTNIPRAAWGDPAGNSRFSDRWIEDGSYLRLRTVSLSYNIPVKTPTLKYIKIYATGNNLFTWTKYLGYDPEFSSSNGLYGQGVDLGLLPVYKTVQLGVRLGF